jgi:hypothetical protein
LVSVNVSVALAWRGTVNVLKDFVNTGTKATSKVAVAAGADPPVNVSTEVVFVKTPVAGAVTFVTIVHDPPAGTVPPDRAIDVDVSAVVPPQLFVKVIGVTTVSPKGRVSLKVTPVAVSAVGLVIVKVRLVVPPGGMALAPNAFVNDGATTFKVAVAGNK